MSLDSFLLQTQTPTYKRNPYNAEQYQILFCIDVLILKVKTVNSELTEGYPADYITVTVHILFQTALLNIISCNRTQQRSVVALLGSANGCTSTHKYNCMFTRH